VVEQHRLDGVEQGVEGDVLGLEGGVDFVGLDVVELSERGDEGAVAVWVLGVVLMVGNYSEAGALVTSPALMVASMSSRDIRV
jgi:hypothetical protein